MDAAWCAIRVTLHEILLLEILRVHLLHLTFALRAVCLELWTFPRRTRVEIDDLRVVSGRVHLFRTCYDWIWWALV